MNIRAADFACEVSSRTTGKLAKLANFNGNGRTACNEPALPEGKATPKMRRVAALAQR